jgi:DNA mismatch endonuclease (patch repair protein)
MVDTVGTWRRSEIMARVRNKDTKPEMIVRRITHGLGYRYRLHYKHLPGRPDLVFPARRKVIFVHGCFWHRHEGCDMCRTPKSHTAFWTEKFEANVSRDRANQEMLRLQGWEVLIVWECETYRSTTLPERIEEFLDG